MYLKNKLVKYHKIMLEIKVFWGCIPDPEDRVSQLGRPSPSVPPPPCCIQRSSSRCTSPGPGDHWSWLWPPHEDCVLQQCLDTTFSVFCWLRVLCDHWQQCPWPASASPCCCSSAVSWAGWWGADDAGTVVCRIHTVWDISLLLRLKRSKYRVIFIIHPKKLLKIP